MKGYNERLLEQRITQLQGQVNTWTMISVGFFFCFVLAMFYILFTRVI